MLRTFRITKTFISGNLAGLTVVDTFRASSCDAKVGDVRPALLCSGTYQVTSVEVTATGGQ